jgi:hypothetical protein
MSDAMAQQLMVEIANLSRGVNGQGPLGIEALVMSISGEGTPGKGDTLCGSLNRIADSIENLAEAVRESGIKSQ